MGPKESFDKICSMLEADDDLRKLDSQYQCKFNADDLTGTAQGKQFKANLAVTESEAGATVEIIVDLPFHLALVKGVVEKTLKAKMNKVLTS